MRKTFMDCGCGGEGLCGELPDAGCAQGGGASLPDRALLRQCGPGVSPAVVDGGSYIGFDRIGILRLQPDEVRADNLAKLVRDGFTGQIMMSQDRHCGWLGRMQRQLSAAEQADIDGLRAAGKWPPPYTYMFTEFLPMLHARGVNQGDIATMLDENPRRFFAGEGIAGKV